MELLPHAHCLFSPWLVIIGAVIAYSSASHMGFIIIGIGSITNIGLNDAILQILSHGFLGGNGLIDLAKNNMKFYTFAFFSFFKTKFSKFLFQKQHYAYAMDQLRKKTCMLLARILLKMGAYGLIRVNMELLPHVHCLFYPWLVIIGAVIAYSSASHMGFIIIGIGSITNIGLNGAI
ncbi:hypothetical protein ACJX0J_025325 [Zea mays]